MRLTERTLAQIDSPISAAYDLLALRDDSQDLLDVAQAAPPYPPARAVVDHVIAVAGDPAGSTYTEVPGLPHLRQAFAAELSRDYAEQVTAENVVITAGCNQAFSLAATALADPGDEIVVPLPYLSLIHI